MFLHAVSKYFLKSVLKSLLMSFNRGIITFLEAGEFFVFSTSTEVSGLFVCLLYELIQVIHTLCNHFIKLYLLMKCGRNIKIRRDGCSGRGTVITEIVVNSF